jgi:hypothetical protein
MECLKCDLDLKNNKVLSTFATGRIKKLIKGDVKSDNAGALTVLLNSLEQIPPAVREKISDIEVSSLRSTTRSCGGDTVAGQTVAGCVSTREPQKIYVSNLLSTKLMYHESIHVFEGYMLAQRIKASTRYVKLDDQLKRKGYSDNQLIDYQVTGKYPEGISQQDKVLFDQHHAALKDAIKYKFVRDFNEAAKDSNGRPPEYAVNYEDQEGKMSEELTMLSPEKAVKKGFVSGYAGLAEEEDRAETAACLLAETCWKDRIKRNPNIKKKYAVLCKYGAGIKSTCNKIFPKGYEKVTS